MLKLWHFKNIFILYEKKIFEEIYDIFILIRNASDDHTMFHVPLAIHCLYIMSEDYIFDQVLSSNHQINKNTIIKKILKYQKHISDKSTVQNIIRKIPLLLVL